MLRNKLLKKNQIKSLQSKCQKGVVTPRCAPQLEAAFANDANDEN